MDKIEEIRAKIGECDDIIIKQLAVRMSHIQEIISYKKATGIPILQPEQEKKQTDALAAKLGDNEFEEEILDIFKYIMKNSRRIQAKSLFDYNIFLIGFMGAGKSTVAGELKDKLEMDRVEMDQMIVENRGMSISEIFDEFGEAYFRNLESNTLIELQNRKQTIVSCGGGVVMREENADHMKKNGRVVLLTAKPETIYERVKDSDERPILNGNMNVAYISSLMEKRRERYEAVADVTVATDGKNVTQICEEIIAKLIALDNENVLILRNNGQYSNVYSTLTNEYIDNLMNKKIIHTYENNSILVSSMENSILELYSIDGKTLLLSVKGVNFSSIYTSNLSCYCIIVSNGSDGVAFDMYGNVLVKGNYTIEQMSEIVKNMTSYERNIIIKENKSLVLKV